MSRLTNKEYWEQVLAMDAKLTDREIIEDLAVCDWIDPTQPTRKIILDLIAWNSKIALDPQVSQEAVDLYLQGYSDGKEQAANRYLKTADPTDDQFHFEVSL